LRDHASLVAAVNLLEYWSVVFWKAAGVPCEKVITLTSIDSREVGKGRLHFFEACVCASLTTARNWVVFLTRDGALQARAETAGAVTVLTAGHVTEVFLCVEADQAKPGDLGHGGVVVVYWVIGMCTRNATQEYIAVAVKETPKEMPIQG
jgi:L-ascorbate metabolism protein UlaG (beta-lactamase superfamily)